MVKAIYKVVDYSEFTHKTFLNGEVRINVKSIDGFRELTKYFDKCRIGYYSFQSTGSFVLSFKSSVLPQKKKDWTGKNRSETILP